MMEMSYKEQHEAFVSDNLGSTIWEIILISAVCPLSVFVRDVTCSWLYEAKSLSVWSKCLLDFVLLVLPLLFSCTLFSSCIECLLMSMSAFGLIMLFVHNKIYVYDWQRLACSLEKLSDTSLLHDVITQFRAFANVATGILILAVDFTVFPRRFCKTETYGTGLMDIGVGGFIVANGIVSPEARWNFPEDRDQNKVKQLLHSVKSTIPLWALGLMRILAVKSTDYHEHTSEYGVHWNFFFTLAIVKVLSCLILFIFPVVHMWLLSIIILCIYEYLLEAVNLKDFILHGSDGSGKRIGFLDANREGICSSLGYLALYLASVSLGSLLAQRRSNYQPYVKYFSALALDIVLWTILYFLVPNIIPVSRRMANASYVLWMLAHNMLVISCLFVVGITTRTLCHSHWKLQRSADHRQVDLLEAINRNGLVYFLLANIFTGLINISVKTIYASQTTAYCILIGYTFILAVTALSLHINRITVKFW